jgi:hypothetical protein
MRRRGVAIVPLLTVLFTLCLYGSQATIMEGRYRKPLEPLSMLAVFWLTETKMRRPRVRPYVHGALTCPVGSARRQLPELVRLAQGGQEVRLTDQGEPVARIVRL